MIHLIPIAVVAVLSAAIVLERFLALCLVYPLRGSDGFFDKIRKLVRAGKIGEAAGFCERYRGKPVGRVVSEALVRASEPETIIEHNVAIAISEMSRKVQKRTGYLAMLANVATLLGLFGTILGLIHSFEALGSASGAERSALLTQGISTAMTATMWGLGVAIPCMLIYSFLANRTNRHLSEIEEAGIRVMEILKEHYYGNGKNIEDEEAA